MKTYQIMSFVVFLTMLFSANAYAMQINGYNVVKVVYSSGHNPTGEFVQKGNQWLEKSYHNNRRFHFTERNRDEWSVYLYDRSRQVNIQLDLHRNKIIYSQGNGVRSDLYNIVRGESGFRGSAVNGFNASRVVYSTADRPMGEFVKTSHRRWVEYSDHNGLEFNFKERNRDEWSVYLYDRSRDVHIQLDLHRKRVIYSQGNGPRSDIYTVISSSDRGYYGNKKIKKWHGHRDNRHRNSDGPYHGNNRHQYERFSDNNYDYQHVVKKRKPIKCGVGRGGF